MVQHADFNVFHQECVQLVSRYKSTSFFQIEWCEWSASTYSGLDHSCAHFCSSRLSILPRDANTKIPSLQMDIAAVHQQFVPIWLSSSDICLPVWLLQHSKHKFAMHQICVDSLHQVRVVEVFFYWSSNGPLCFQNIDSHLLHSRAHIDHSFLAAQRPADSRILVQTIGFMFEERLDQFVLYSKLLRNEGKHVELNLPWLTIFPLEVHELHLDLCRWTATLSLHFAHHAVLSQVWSNWFGNQSVLEWVTCSLYSRIWIQFFQCLHSTIATNTVLDTSWCWVCWSALNVCWILFFFAPSQREEYFRSYFYKPLTHLTVWTIGFYAGAYRKLSNTKKKTIFNEPVSWLDLNVSKLSSFFLFEARCFWWIRFE